MSTPTPNAAELATKLALHNRWRRGDDDVDSPRGAELGFVFDDAATLLRTQAARIAELEAELLREHADHAQTVEDAAAVVTENRRLLAALAQQVPEPQPVNAQMLEALKANHQWHQDYDDFDGYPESELCEQNTRAITAAEAEQARSAQQVPAVPSWVPVTEAMPASGVTVLACYRNRLGNLRRIRANWIAAKSAEASSDSDSGFAEYDEETDTYYDPEGWYERIDNWGDYSAVAVCEGEVTHWMPLPAAPLPTPEKPA